MYTLLQFFLFISIVNFSHVLGDSVVPVISLDSQDRVPSNRSIRAESSFKFLPFVQLIKKDKDTSEYWHETKLITIVQQNENQVDYESCDQNIPEEYLVKIPSRRTVRPICRSKTDYQLCPQCPHFNNHTECELFKDSCKERRVQPHEYKSYCDKKYGRWRSMFVAADYTQCRCCDECIFYRELDQSCIEDENNFKNEESLPVTSIDFRAGCNPYWGHPEQEMRALRCDKMLRRCVPISVPVVPKGNLNLVYRYRYKPTSEALDCPMDCRNYACPMNMKPETDCVPGAFVPETEYCNCCGNCSAFKQLKQKCAEFKKFTKIVNGTKKIEVEEEFLEPGCDDGLVCRHGRCQDIHDVRVNVGKRTRRDKGLPVANEPCKQELKFFVKKYGPDGHLHYNAPQCTPLWLYAPVQCRRFVCYCALEDGSFVQGIKVPRVEVANMNCDCAREKCRTNSDIECDGYGNYREAVFTPHVERWHIEDDDNANETNEKDLTA